MALATRDRGCAIKDDTTKMDAMPQGAKVRMAAALGGIAIATGLGIWGVFVIDRIQYFNKIAADLAAEEGDDGDSERAGGPTAADKYVADFKQVVEIGVTASGFSPSNIVVAPDTKLVFKAADDVAHFVQVPPGGRKPKFFDPRLDLVKGTVFQTKVSDVGSYSFYDRNAPTNNLTVTVAK